MSDQEVAASVVPVPDVMGAYYQGRLDMMTSILDVLARNPEVLSLDWLRNTRDGAARQLAQHEPAKASASEALVAAQERLRRARAEDQVTKAMRDDGCATTSKPAKASPTTS